MPKTFRMLLFSCPKFFFSVQTILTFLLLNNSCSKGDEPPVAVAFAEPLVGNAPLLVKFDGSKSTDDEMVEEYFWNFSEQTSTLVSPEHTFHTPGIYEVLLRVTDNEGLAGETKLTVTVLEPNQIENTQISCEEGGGKADESGRKIWCWNDVSIPSYSDRKGIAVSNRELHVDSECYENQVSIVEDRLQFHVNPTGPQVGSWCENDFNMRAEIRTSPWPIRHTPGTEEWFGWTYYFEDDYIIDSASQWLFFQVHNGIRGENALIAIWVVHEGQFSGHDAGELFVVNSSTPGSPIYSPTGFKPMSGTKLDVVVQVIWGDENTGLLNVWFNGNQVYSATGRTITPTHDYGGNAKWGIYKWPWRKSDGVESSKSVGVTSIKTSMGPLRIITRKPDDPNYRKYSFEAVSPD